MDEDMVNVYDNNEDIDAPSNGVWIRRRNFVAFWLIGMINNFHYCLVLSASDDIAQSYNLKSYVALISWANVAGGLAVRALNAFVYPAVPYKKRFLFAGFQTLFGILILVIAPYCGDSNGFRFALSLIGVVFVGNGSSYGESVALGYMERFPSEMVGGWSSGTGLSGVLATLIFMGLVALKLSNSLIFGISASILLVYWGCFYFVLVAPAQDDPLTYVNNWVGLSWSEPEVTKNITDTERRHLVANEPDEGRADEQGEVRRFSWDSMCFWRTEAFRRVWALHNSVFALNINLLLVYLFEYAVQFVAPFSFPCELSKTSSNFLIRNSFIISQFCYQCGVLISRSSLACVRIRRVGVITILQAVNCVMWFIQAKTLLLSSDDTNGEIKYAIILQLWMIYVGLLGGASYVNVFYNILEETRGDGEDAQAAKEKRQLCMNIGALYAVGGITLGCLVDVIFSNTVLTGSC